MKSREQPKIVGIVNITEDSFSDGGLFLDPGRAIEHACRLSEAGADLVELGASSSHPDSRPVDARQEIERLDPVLDDLIARGIAVAIDSSLQETQLHCLRRGVSMLNDVKGFPDSTIYPDLASASCRLVVMHSRSGLDTASRQAGEAAEIYRNAVSFLEQRTASLRENGIGSDRLVIDPGMGFFLASNPEPSLHVLANLQKLRRSLGLPLMVSVSRKSFLGSVTGKEVAARGPATLAAEIHAAANGADYIRTHDVAALSDALAVTEAITKQS